MTEVTRGARPAELVPGEPDEVERLAARLARFAAGAAEAAARMGTLDAGAWSGQAGGLFREAVGEVPTRLTRAAAAFATAARALTTYATVLREGQAAAAQAVRLVGQATPETLAAEQETAARLVARARTEVEDAGRIAAARLAEAAADAPVDAAEGPGGASGRISVQVVGEHQLTDPDGFVAPPGDWGESVADVRYTEPHEVGFVGGSASADAGLPAEVAGGSSDWDTWAAADPRRDLGVIEPGVLAALGLAAVGLTVIGRRRREETALTLVGIDDAELRRRREEFGGPRHRDGVLVPARAGRLRSADAWRTRLASTPRPGGTVQHWAGPAADPLSRSRAGGERLGSVDREVRGAVLRTGRPAREGA